MEQPGNVPPMSPSQPPPPQRAFGMPQQTAAIVGLGDWFVSILVTSIPIVNIIILLVWAFSSGTNPNKANWAKAMLLWALVGIVVVALILAVVGTALFHALNTD